MKKLIFILLLANQLFASIDDIYNFTADFTQTITDDKNKVLTYRGDITASKPQSAVWRYTQPITKNVFILNSTVTIVEPEIEQAIIKRIDSNFNIFKMLNDAKKVADKTYVTKFKGKAYTIIMQNNKIDSISYIDEFENRVKITFQHQKINTKIDKAVFIPQIPIDFDIIDN